MGQEEKRKEEELKREVAALAKELAAGLEEGKLKEMFLGCFVSTADTTARFLPEGRAYVITGDIEAMWLRDSSAQVSHYLPYLKHFPMLRELVRGLALQQMEFICIDPYANAFNQEASGRCFEKDETESSPWVWERKYEVDSLCYPIRLLKQYRQAAGDDSIFGDRTKEALERIVGVWEAQQRHEEWLDYSFVRRDCPDSDTLSNNGKGSPCAYTGMTWSGFRPSDDACQYGYLIPANFFAAAALGYVTEFAREIYKDEKLALRAERLAEQILEGIRKYGIVETREFGPVYAYETDGLGHYNLMDDANVPSLLSLPWLEAPGFFKMLLLRLCHIPDSGSPAQEFCPDPFQGPQVILQGIAGVQPRCSHRPAQIILQYWLCYFFVKCKIHMPPYTIPAAGFGTNSKSLITGRRYLPSGNT